ncbi:hypothetical protein D3C76_1233110 [compost metagenome]
MQFCRNLTRLNAAKHLSIEQESKHPIRFGAKDGEALPCGILPFIRCQMQPFGERHILFFFFFHITQDLANLFCIHFNPFTTEHDIRNCGFSQCCQFLRRDRFTI